MDGSNTTIRDTATVREAVTARDTTGRGHESTQ